MSSLPGLRLARATVRPLAITIPLALLAVNGCGGRPETPLPASVGQLLRSTLEADTQPAEVRDQEERQHVWEDMELFYSRRLWQPAWTGASGPHAAAEALLELIPQVAAEGVNPARYRREELAQRVATLAEARSFEDPEMQRRLVETDLQLTYAFMTLAHHLAAGRETPRSINVEWYTKPRDVDLGAQLAAALERPQTLAESVLRLAPPHDEYERLRAAVAAYREQAAKGEWPPVPPGPTLARGAAGETGETGETGAAGAARAADAAGTASSGPRVAALRARLAASGDLPPEAAGGGAGQQAALFDEALEQAVRRFQARHGLGQTGAVDKATLAALEAPIGARIRQMELNMERWRWLPADLGERHIVVNVPDYTMRVVEGDRSPLAMRVVVGKDQSRTPAFSDKMTYIELNPYWNIPPSILDEEILPQLASDPGYLASHDMEVVNEEGEAMRVRQRPGPANPLGQIKFMFPNQFNIYLHDTPAGHLFDRTDRTFSHGCIRIEKPLALAAHLLRGDARWNRASLVEAITSGESRTIELPRPIAVHILYWTAWVDPDGSVQLRDDIYGHDATLDAALRDEPPLDLDLPAVGGAQRAAR